MSLLFGRGVPCTVRQRGRYAALRSTHQRTCRVSTANTAEVRYEGPWSGTSHSRDEDHAESSFATVVSISVRLHPTNFGALQHAFGSICYDTASRQPSAVTERLPDTRSGGGPYEVSAIRTGCWLVNVRYGRDAARHSACGWSRKQIYAQSRPPTLGRSEAYLQISG
jgi:hypothetical protein